MKKPVWITFALLSITIGLYPVGYFFMDASKGLLSLKPAALLVDLFWKTGFYTHIIFGGITLLTGWSQFHRKWRQNTPEIHRNIGKVYVFCALVSAVAAIGVSFSATGGPTATAGFFSLGAVWLSTTWMAYRHIRQGDIASHERWMIYSYAACFGAVMLRLWMPLLMALNGGDFVPAYRVVAWLCWLPNMGVAWWMVRRKSI